MIDKIWKYTITSDDWKIISHTSTITSESDWWYSREMEFLDIDKQTLIWTDQNILFDKDWKLVTNEITINDITYSVSQNEDDKLITFTKKI